MAALAAAASLVHSACADTAVFAFNIPREDLAMALNQIAQQSHIEIAYSAELTRGKISPLLKGTYTPEQALKMLLKGSELHVRRIVGGALVIEKEGSGKSPASGQRPTSNSDATMQMGEIIVTASRREKSARSRFPRGHRGLPWSQGRFSTRFLQGSNLSSIGAVQMLTPTPFPVRKLKPADDRTLQQALGAVLRDP